MAVRYWIKITTNPKKLMKSLLIIAILVLLGVILYKLFAPNNSSQIENFAVALNSGSIFGNYINATINKDTTGVYTYNLSDTYRIEAIQISGINDATNYTINYSNNGKQFKMNQQTGNQIISQVVNSTGDKIYTNSLQFAFTNSDGSLYTGTAPTISIYGMKLGDYDIDYYTNESAGNKNFSCASTGTSDNLPNDNDPSDSSISKHYFSISKDITEPENRLVKAVNYSINLGGTTPTGSMTKPLQITVQYTNTISKTIYYVSNHAGTDEQVFNLNRTSGTIYFSVPILASMVIFKVKNNPSVNFSRDMTLIGKNPDDVESNTYSIPQYIRSNIYSIKCPSVDIINNNQNLTKQLCDELENQDKLRIEQIKLEKEKQYLIKLKKQDDDITNLQAQITAIENNRKNRDAVLDNLKLAQFQKQREEAVQLRDAANEQLSAQKVNSLNLDVNLVQEST